MKRDIVIYCRSDVEILRRACIAFRRIFMEVGKVCPFTESATIASACSRVFRKNFLKEQSIALLPSGERYRRAERHSKIAIEWLVQCEREYQREIIHAGRSREYRLSEGPIVDGYLPPDLCDNIVAEGCGSGGGGGGGGDDGGQCERGTVFQFHGCYYHGCPRCFTESREKKRRDGDTFQARFENTRVISKKIGDYGYRLIEKWECDFRREKSEDPNLAAYVENHPLASVKILNPRDAFYGGRTGNTTSFYRVKDGEQIRYTDVCSLYPYICKTGKFPVGHPKVFVGRECMKITDLQEKKLNGVEGLVSCTVLPPRNLYHPVLPVKMHSRLLFPLCRSCCENECQEDCSHENPRERELTGTWVSDELKKAIEMGYRICKIYEIWQYEITQFDATQ